MYQRSQDQESLKSSENLSSNSPNLLNYFALNHFENQANAVMSPAVLANNYLFLKIRTATRGCLVDCAKKERRGSSGAWLERRLSLWQSCLPKIYHSSSQNHNFQCLPLFQIIMYKHSRDVTVGKFLVQLLQCWARIRLVGMGLRYLKI